MNYKPHAAQAKAHKAFLVDGYERGVLFWGRQVGKSLWSVMHVTLAAVHKQGPYHIVFNTREHAKKVMWRQYLHMIPEELIADTNATDLVITFKYLKGPFFLPGIGWIAVNHDTTKPPSTIQLLGSDFADDHRGMKSNGMIFDEYQDQDPMNFEVVYKYFFTTTKGWAVFMGTAKGYNHWYEMIMDAKEEKNTYWYYQEATWRENPAVDPAWIENQRNEAERKGMLDTFMQEVELQFRVLEGSVYPMFDRNVHVIDPADKRIPTDGTLFITWDFGWAEGHPTAINFVLVDTHGRRWCLDEINGTMLDFDDLIQMVVMKAAGRKVQAVIADSARPDLVDILRNKLSPRLQAPVLDSPKRQNSVPAGIQLLGQKIRPKMNLTGMPEPDYYFTSNCRHTIYQMENYRYKEVKKDRPISDLPMKKNDDHPDGLRYLELYLKYGLVAKQTPIRPSVTFGEYGLLKNI